jgi:NAD(P)-dependent dehydrogenase (short-subunit alcohol dehydrogenase family)
MALEGKVVIITGGAMGIGRYNARTFAARGAHVAVADVAPMDTVAAEVAQLGGELMTVPTDVRDEQQVQALMSQVNARYGRIDVLINGAGIVTHFGWNPRWPVVKDMPLDFFDKVMRTNLYGTFLCTKHVLPYMQAQQSGHIINFGQAKVFGAEARPEAGAAIYHVTKVGIEVFTEEVAPELREFNICMVSMSPGATVTEEAPADVRMGARGVDAIGDRYLLAAEAPMEFSGYHIAVEDGRLVRGGGMASQRR